MENANVQLTLESKINGDEISDVKEYITTDYNKFSYVKINRDINRKYVAKLKNSMKEKGYVGPGILVNENLEILDGQHRFISCQELGIPVKYIVKTGYSIEEIAALNMNGHNWNVNTFIDSYVKSDKEDYKFFKDVTQKYGISTAALKVIITHFKKEFAETPEEKKIITSGKIANDINHGTLVITDKEREHILDFLDALEIFKFFKKYHTDTFIRAFLELYTRKDYSQLQMIKRLEKFDDFLVEKKNKFYYLDVLCNDIYSKGRGIKIYYNLNRRKFEGK